MINNIEDIIKYSNTLNLLYVEDNDDARKSMCRILEDFFSNIVIAKDGQDGLNKFSQNSIDIIITDINMPLLNGLEMIEKIREMDENIPILILSAHNESNYFIESIRLGVDGYLLKPIDMLQFQTTLFKVVSKQEIISEAKKNDLFLKQYREITDKSSIITIIDTNNIITYVNDAFCEVSQYSKDELIGKNYYSTLKYQQSDEIEQEIWNTIKIKKEIWQGVLKYVSRYGNTYYFKKTIKPILDIDDNIIEYIALRDDVTEIMNPKKQLHDAIKNHKDPVVVYMKLDDFKTLEEFYDNKIVDEIQDKITIFLENQIPDECVFTKVYQLGNGEYAMTGEASSCLVDKQKFLNRIKDYQEQLDTSTINVSNIDYDISVLISVAYESDRVLESSRLGIRELLNTSQEFIVSNNFAKLEHKKAQKNMDTVTMVKEAISQLKIISLFQPIINNKTGLIEKYESLVRLKDNQGNTISPAEFLDISKKGKYYSQITNIVLDNSFNALESTDKDITINLSPLDIEQKSTRDKLFTLLHQNLDNCPRIVFELLEDESVKDFNMIKEFIQEVKCLGVKIAIDDFGAGYSNFERLLSYQPDIIKIDGSLIKEIETNAYSLSVVETIISFAKKQGILTVAEFVENENIFEILKKLDVDYSQGYYFGAPKALTDE